MIKTHCLLSPLFNQCPESAKKCLSQALQMPHICKPPRRLRLFSRCPGDCVRSRLLCSWRKTGSTLFVVSEQRQLSPRAATQALSVAHSLSRSIILALGRTFARSRLLGPLLFVCLFSPSTWSGLVFSFVKNNKNIHWETFAGLVSGHHSYLFCVINHNSPFPLLPRQGSWWFMVDSRWNLSEWWKISKNYQEIM